MHTTTTGKDIFLDVQKTLQNYSLQWDQLPCAMVDGGRNMAGVRNGFVGQILSQLEDRKIHTHASYISMHCVGKTWRFLVY